MADTCEGIVYDYDFVEGERGTPEPLATLSCDGCDGSSENDKMSFSYTEEIGFQVCWSMGFEIGMGVPLGPSWQMTSETEICFDNTVSTSATVTLSCVDGGIKEGDFLRTPIEMIATVYVTETRCKNYEPDMTYPEDWCPGCRCSEVFDEGPVKVCRVCGNVAHEGSAVIYDYHLDVATTPCVPPVEPGEI